MKEFQDDVSFLEHTTQVLLLKLLHPGYQLLGFLLPRLGIGKCSSLLTQIAMCGNGLGPWFPMFAAVVGGPHLPIKQIGSGFVFALAIPEHLDQWLGNLVGLSHHWNPLFAKAILLLR